MSDIEKFEKKFIELGIHIDRYDETIKKLEKKYDNLNTLSSNVSGILSILNKRENENGKLTKKEITIQKKYRDYIHETRKKLDNKEPEPFNNDMKLEKLREVWEKYDKNRKYKLITGLYLYIEPLRSDYAGATLLEDNKIRVRLMKVNIGEYNTINIPEILHEYLDCFDLLPVKNSAFINILRTASENIFGEQYSINTYRHIWAEYGKRMMSISEQIELAKKMNHSMTIHEARYLPKQEIVYTDTIVINNSEIFKYVKENNINVEEYLLKYLRNEFNCSEDSS